VARHIFQACPVWIYTQSNITNNVMEYYKLYNVLTLYSTVLQ
jgi:hypothetical protein